MHSHKLHHGGYPGGHHGGGYPAGNVGYPGVDSWIPTSAYAAGGMPPHAVHAGHDSDGSAIYVGRAFHQGEFLPAKIIPNKRTGYICWGGQEIAVTNYDILCGGNYSWIYSSGGAVPPNAVQSGNTTQGEPLYIGRGNHSGSLTPGKIHPSHGCLYIPYGGQEVKLHSYEVLIRAQVINWVRTSPGHVPPMAVRAGHDSNGDEIYVGRAYHQGDQLPAKVVPNKNCAYVSFDGAEQTVYDYEVLCGNGFQWIGSASGHVPANAVEAGRTGCGEVLYVGRGHHQGSLTPGKIHPSHNCLYIPYGGSEISLRSYECLVHP